MTPVFCSPKVFRFAALSVFILAFGIGLAEGIPSTPTAGSATQQTPEAKQPPAQGPAQPGINNEFEAPLAAESAKAAGEGTESTNSQVKMVEELKYSPSVRWMSEHLHVSPGNGYWIGIFIDFAILALLIGYAMKKNLPAVFRTRTQTIQRAMEQARKASEEANRRLADIESRLAKLDAEIAAMHSASEREAAAEEQRIVAAAEEDKHRMITMAEAEIAAAAKLARRELRAFAADLAVNLAERRIHVDATTDRALVRNFVSQLSDADGGNGARKDGK